MIWIVVIVCIVIVIALFSSNEKKTEETQNKAEHSELIKNRAGAYLDYLRRTSDRTDIKAMTDKELQDHLQTNIRSFNSEKNTAINGAGTLWVIIVFAGMMMAAAQEKWEPLILLGIVGTGLVLFIGWITEKNRTKKYRAKGFDPERLEIDQ